MEASTPLETKDFNSFQSTCKHFGIEINNNQLILFKRHYEILTDWNTKINLISRKEDNILGRHFLDSILFLPEIENLCTGVGPYARTVFDIGSGGGFPGIPLAIMKPDWKFTLCESVKKKADFLDHVVKELDFDNVTILNARVETLHVRSLRYDLITARAIDKLNELIKYSIPILKSNGYLLAYKSKNIEDEINAAKKIIERNKLKLKILSKELNGVERKLVILSHPSIL